MKIVHITSHLNVGGVARAVLSLSRGLIARDHSVSIVSGGGALAGEAQGMSADSIRLPLATSIEFHPKVWMAAAALVRRLRRHPPDVLHGHTRVGQVAAALVSRRLQIPYVTTWHGFFRQNLGRRLWPCTGRAAVAISEPVRQHLIRDIGISESRIHLIPHGIDPAPFEVPVPDSRLKALRHGLGLGNGPVIGTVARLVASKGVDRLIRALPEIRAVLPGAQLLIVGDGEERPALERLAAGHGMEEAAVFAGSLSETREALLLMDVFVFLPADREGFGLSLLEAMAAARPIVAVRQGGGAPWVLEQAGIRSIVEPDRPSDLAAVVSACLKDKEHAAAEGARMRVIIKERYSIERMLDAYEALYRSVKWKA